MYIHTYAPIQFKKYFVLIYVQFKNTLTCLSSAPNNNASNIEDHHCHFKTNCYSMNFTPDFNIFVQNK